MNLDYLDVNLDEVKKTSCDTQSEMLLRGK